MGRHIKLTMVVSVCEDTDRGLGHLEIESLRTGPSLYLDQIADDLTNTFAKTRIGAAFQIN